MPKLIRRRTAAHAASPQLGELHPLLARVYAGRGVSSVSELELDFSALLPPSALMNADRAANVLADALASLVLILHKISKHL